MDIAHLRSISDTHSHVIYVDSSTRDKTAHPEPAEYSVDFDSPFHNVVGMDILDASIPATMYTVDADNCGLSLYCRTGGRAEPSGCFACVRDTPRTAAYRALLEAASSTEDPEPLRFKFFRDDSDPADIEVVAPGASTAVASAYVVARRSMAAVKVVRAATSASGGSAALSAALATDAGAYAVQRETGGGYSYAQVAFSAGSGRFEAVAGARAPLVTETGVDTATGAPTEYAYVTAGGDQSAALYRVPAAGLVGAPLWSGEAEYAPNGQRLAAAESGVVGAQSAGVLTFVWCARATPGYYAGLQDYLHEVRAFTISIDKGDHDTESLLEALRFAMPKRDDETQRVVLGSASVVNSNNFKRNRNLRFQSQDPFWIDAGKSTAREVLGFSGRAPVQLDARDIFSAANDASVFNNVYRLDAPGVINLFGRRFITLRCPEIEQHSNSALSCGRNSAGVGLFKLYDVTIAHLRFDFVNNRKIEFHPIGKLARLKFRFELLDGNQYDFKGVDHHLFIALHFLRPRNVMHIHTPLNPDYEPDILKYITDRRQEVDESDTDSDKELLDNPQHMRRFLDSRNGGAQGDSRNGAQGDNRNGGAQADNRRVSTQGNAWNSSSYY